MDTNWDKRVLELALARHNLASDLPVMQEQRDTAYDVHVAPLDNEIARRKAAVEYLDAQLRADMLAYVQETGDLDLHPAVRFVRATKVMYDKDAAIEALQKRGSTNLLRIKTELDVKRFERAVRAGDLPEIDAEIVNVPHVAIAPLGDLVILHEAGQLDAEGRPVEKEEDVLS